MIMFVFFFLIMRHPPISTLFPYTTLFRSRLLPLVLGAEALLPVLAELLGGGPIDARHRLLVRLVRIFVGVDAEGAEDRKSTRLNSSHSSISYAVFCLKKKRGFDNANIDPI